MPGTTDLHPLLFFSAFTPPGSCLGEVSFCPQEGQDGLSEGLEQRSHLLPSCGPAEDVRCMSQGVEAEQDNEGTTSGDTHCTSASQQPGDSMSGLPPWAPKWLQTTACQQASSNRVVTSHSLRA